eukprot:CFRG1608T1
MPSDVIEHVQVNHHDMVIDELERKHTEKRKKRLTISAITSLIKSKLNDGRKEPNPHMKPRGSILKQEVSAEVLPPAPTEESDEINERRVQFSGKVRKGKAIPLSEYSRQPWPTERFNTSSYNLMVKWMTDYKRIEMRVHPDSSCFTHYLDPIR